MSRVDFYTCNTQNKLYNCDLNNVLRSIRKGKNTTYDNVSFNVYYITIMVKNMIIASWIYIVYNLILWGKYNKK